MKIKRREYNRLRAIANLRITVDTPMGAILNVTAEHAYLISYYMNETDAQYMQFNGPVIVKFERAALPSASTTTTPATEKEQ